MHIKICGIAQNENEIKSCTPLYEMPKILNKVNSEESTSQWIQCQEHHDQGPPVEINSTYILGGKEDEHKTN